MSSVNWKTVCSYQDIRYEKADKGIAKITIARPEVRNAFRPKTLFELIDAFTRVREDPAVGVVLFTGEGSEAFCSGGDQRVRGDAGYIDDDGRIRHRRRARTAPAVRPHARGRERSLRPDRPPGR
jgi:naphthoate synthase